MVTGEILKVLEGFHQRAARQITGMTAAHAAVGEWGYPLVVTAMETARLHPIREYIRRRQANIAKKVVCRLIYEMYAVAERIPRTSRVVRWWDQEVVNEPDK